MKKYLIYIALSFLVTSMSLARVTGCKEGNCENGYGFTQIKQLTKVIGLVQKNMVKVPKLGLMVLFIKENLKTAYGVGRVHYIFQMAPHMLESGPMDLWTEKELLLGLTAKKRLELG